MRKWFSHNKSCTNFQYCNFNFGNCNASLKICRQNAKPPSPPYNSQILCESISFLIWTLANQFHIYIANQIPIYIKKLFLVNQFQILLNVIKNRESNSACQQEDRPRHHGSLLCRFDKRPKHGEAAAGSRRD